MKKLQLLLIIRQIRKQAAISLIDLVVMSIALATIILLGSYVLKSQRFDQFHSNLDQIYRLEYDYKPIDRERQYDALTDMSYYDKLKEKWPVFKKVSRFRDQHSVWVVRDENGLKGKVVFADPDFLEIFTFPGITPTPSSLLDEPNNVIITKELAQKLVLNNEGDLEDLVGRAIKVPSANNAFFKIAAILEDIPSESSIQFDFILPYEQSKYSGRSGGNSIHFTDDKSSPYQPGTNLKRRINQRSYETIVHQKN